jgi:NAD(P)-dependent dehydrogenase (short-subunit alcohol dehydrogenase family)
MDDFTGKVAVITGAASGIGRGLAERCVQKGMKVVLADIEATALDETAAALETAGGDVLAVLTDVSKAAEVEQLAQRTLARYGAVHLLFNNAGVVAPDKMVWENSLADWEWVLGVNLWGVIHGLRSFVPLMLRQEDESHIVNTASIAGLIYGSTSYTVSKHAVVALSEALALGLAEQTTQVKVSVLCPGWVNTQILDAERNRPPIYWDEPAGLPLSGEGSFQRVEATPQGESARRQAARESLQQGMDPQEVADHVFRAIRENSFYIFPHPELKEAIQQRTEMILQDGNPTSLVGSPD